WLTDRTHAHKTHRLPIAGQVALTLLLLAAAGGAIKAFVARIYAPLGFDANNLFQLFIELPRSAWPDPINQTRLFDELEMLREAVAQAPGVDGACVSLNWLPLSRERTFGVNIQNRPALTYQATINEVSPQLLAVMRIPLLRGRSFDTAELRRRAPVALVNQKFVKQYLNGVEPIGQILRTSQFPYSKVPPLEIIGVVGDAINNEFDVVKPAVFFPYSVHPDLRPGELLFARASGEPQAAIRSVKARLSQVNPDVVVTQVRTFQRSLETYGWGAQ